MTRVLFIGDLQMSGFGTVTRDLGKALLATGLDVRFLSAYGMPDQPLEEPLVSRTFDVGAFVMSTDGTDPGVAGIQADAIRGIFKGATTGRLANGNAWGDWTPEAAIILGDFLGTRIFLAPLKEEFGALPTFLYLPIEGVGLPPSWADTLNLFHPVAMSQFGAEQIESITGKRPPVAYHGVDTDTFRPVSKRTPVVLKSADKIPSFLNSKMLCKQAWLEFLAEQNGVKRVPKYWLLRTDRHMPRKRYNSLLRSLVPVLARHPDWCLVIHCNPWDQGGNLVDELSKYPQPYRSQVLLTGITGIARDLLVSLYNAADIYVSNSAEGFGLTIAEALACGVPAVGAGFSSVPEVIGNAGVVVNEGFLLDNEYDHTWWATDEKRFGQEVEKLMLKPLRREEMGNRGPLHVRNTFRWDLSAGVFAGLIREAVGEKVAA